MNNSPIKAAVMSFLIIFSTKCHAYVYGEHKRIGDRAFAMFFTKSKRAKSTFFFSSLGVDSAHEALSFLSKGSSYPVTYGVLGGLSGDHVEDPLSLSEELLDQNSKLQSIFSLHEEYLANGFIAAPDKKLAKIDFRYVTLALTNKSHFYMYGKDLEYHLKSFDSDMVQKGLSADTEEAKAVFSKLNSTNSVLMYTTVHQMAITLADQAGKIYASDPAKAKELICKAILFNGFADHFLEDMFSSGHMVINRSIFSSFTNTKALHDFYSEQGTPVIRKDGVEWKAYGDGFLYKGGEDKVIEAVENSLEEVLIAFDKGAACLGTAQQSKILDLIPLPYNRHLNDSFPTERITMQGLGTRGMPEQRNFIRSRIANSIEFGRSTPLLSQNYLQGYEVRLNFGYFAGKYSYNKEGEKKGKLDSWYGYTLSYGWGKIGTISSSGSLSPLGSYDEMKVIKGGLRSNFDVWISDNRFIGVNSYLETGLLFSKGRANPVFVPSVGIQLASLLKLNYYDMPAAVRIPLQLILPLQFRVGTLFSNGYKPSSFHSIDLTIAF
ncbi:hypothetical protein [Flavobacterium sp. FlaQc-48]|uniref:hypothetical protein n=1 Tax=Flavobacterium sp. FlaQc-48 TaxID=3374181 RepID=UPI003756B5D1